MIDDFDKFLSQIKTSLPNPFSVKGTLLKGAETYSDGMRVHKVGNIKVIFEESTKKCTIRFKKIDGVAACALAYLIMDDPYGRDRGLILRLNDRELKKNNSREEGVLGLIQLIEKEENSVNEIKITFSRRNCFDYHKQVLSYWITAWHEDSYYFNKEFDRWQKAEETDEEV